MKSLLPIPLTGENPEIKRQEILEYFQNSYSLFEKLFELFFINKLILAKVITERINPDKEVKMLVEGLIQNLPLQLPITQDDPF